MLLQCEDACQEERGCTGLSCLASLQLGVKACLYLRVSAEVQVAAGMAACADHIPQHPGPAGLLQAVCPIQG